MFRENGMCKVIYIHLDCQKLFLSKKLDFLLHGKFTKFRNERCCNRERKCKVMTTAMAKNCVSLTYSHICCVCICICVFVFVFSYSCVRRKEGARSQQQLPSIASPSYCNPWRFNVSAVFVFVYLCFHICL